MIRTKTVSRKEDGGGAKETSFEVYSNCSHENGKGRNSQLMGESESVEKEAKENKGNKGEGSGVWERGYAVAGTGSGPESGLVGKSSIGVEVPDVGEVDPQGDDTSNEEKAKARSRCRRGRQPL